MPAKRTVNLLDVAENVFETGRRVPVRRRGKIIAAGVPITDYLELEAIDKADLRAHRRAIAEMKRKKQKPIPWAEVRKQLKI